MQIKLSIPDATVAELDRMRGDVTRSRFVQRLIEGIASPATILDAEPARARPPVVEPQRSPTPAVEFEEPRGPSMPSMKSARQLLEEQRQEEAGEG